MAAQPWSSEAESQLREYAWSKVLLAFDFDGTLAPLVDSPADARMRRSTQVLLTEVARRCPVAVISGRPYEDVEPRVREAHVLHVVGNHGLDPLRRMEEFNLQVRLWLPLVQRELSMQPGLEFEDKHYSFAIHYRHSPQGAAAAPAILEVVNRLEGAHAISGHDVINVLPEGAPHKGLAVLDLMERYACDRALYVGDDETDEDVFHVAKTQPFLTFRIGPAPKTEARFSLENQTQVDVLLTRLLELRPSNTGAGPSA